MKLSHIAISLLSFFCVSSCTTQSTKSDFYFYDESVHSQSAGKRVLIAPVPIMPTDNALVDRNAYKVEAAIENYLNRNGYSVVANDEFIRSFQKSESENGGVFNAKTGEFDKNTFNKVMGVALKESRSKTPYDYFVMTAFIAKRTAVSPLTKIGEWDGITRKLDVQNGVDIVPTNPPVISLCNEVFTSLNDRVFKNCAGVEFLVEVNKQGEATIIEKEELFTNAKQLNESIKISFDPFVTK